MSRIKTTDRLVRLVAAIPWIVEQDGAHLDEISNRFDYPRDQLLDDLLDVVLFVGVPPYTPDTLIEVFVEDDVVWIHYADLFSRPMSLTKAESLALLTAGEAVLSLDPSQDAGPLARGLTKLRLSTGTHIDALEVKIGAGQEAVLKTLREAAQRRKSVDIDYFSLSSNDKTRRRIEPYRFFSEGGNWYAEAWCHRAEARRIFRLDRVDDAEVSETPFAHSPDEIDPQTGFGIDDAPIVRIETDVRKSIVFDGVPIKSRSTSEERLMVELPVASASWLERLLIRLGPETKVELPEALAAISASSAAQHVLRRYEHG